MNAWMLLPGLWLFAGVGVAWVFGAAAALGDAGGLAVRPAVRPSVRPSLRPLPSPLISPSVAASSLQRLPTAAAFRPVLKWSRK